MEGHLTLSLKEQTKLMILDRVIKDETTLTEAAALLGVSFRQATRMRNRYRAHGAAGLIHRSRGVPSQRATEADLRRRIAEFAKAKYAGIGPTHFAELLARDEGISIHPETLRLVLIKEGVHHVQKSRRKHRSYRKRKERFGEMIQLDGSDHEWFEKRGARCFLMVMVDDATGLTHAFFSEQETTEAAMEVLTQWITLHGIPGSLYVDRKGVYITSREPTVEEQLAGKVAATQFGAACGKLDIRIIAAHSPQAKGRVEKRNGDPQRRLVVELRLAGVQCIDDANAFLPEFLARFNAKMKKSALSDVDAHRCLTVGTDLRSVFCFEEKRKVAQDWTVAFENRLFQIQRKQIDLPDPRAEVTVQKWRDRSIHILFKGRSLNITEVDLAQRRRDQETRKDEIHKNETRKDVMDADYKKDADYKPADDHPWRASAKTTASTLVFSERRSQQQTLEEIADRIIGAAIPAGWSQKDGLP